MPCPGASISVYFQKKHVRAWRHSFLGPQQAFRVARVGSGLRYKVRYHLSLCLSSASSLPPFPLSAAMLGSLFICISGLMGFLLIPTVFNTRPAQKSSSTTVTKSCFSSCFSDGGDKIQVSQHRGSKLRTLNPTRSSPILIIFIS